MRRIKTFTQAEVSLSRTRPISCESVRVRRSVPLHRHDFTELAIIVQGAALHKTFTETVRLKVGDAIVCARGTSHGFYQPQNLKVINLYFIDEWLTGVVPTLLEEKSFGRLFLPSYASKTCNQEPVIVRLSDRSRRHIAAETRDIELELMETAPDSLCLRLSLLKVLAVICKDYRAQYKTSPHGVYRHEIIKAFEMIDSSIVQGMPTDIASIAKRVGLSTDHFTRVFARAVDLNPCEYAAQRRVELAAAALLNTDKSVTEIALDLGYYDAAHFSHHFLRYKRVSPKSFRTLFAEKS